VCCVVCGTAPPHLAQSPAISFTSLPDRYKSLEKKVTAVLVPMCRCVDVPCVDVSMCRCVGVSVCRCVDVSVCRCVDVSVCRCVGVSVSVCVSVCRCWCVWCVVCVVCGVRGVWRVRRVWRDGVVFKFYLFTVIFCNRSMS
jgi:hypothetical protein